MNGAALCDAMAEPVLLTSATGSRDEYMRGTIYLSDDMHKSRSCGKDNKPRGGEIQDLHYGGWVSISYRNG